MKLFLSVFACAVMTVSCSSSDTLPLPIDDTPLPIDDTPQLVDDPATVFEPTPSDLVINEALYSEDGYATANVIRVDVRTATTAGICTIDDQSGCTLADVIADVDGSDDFKVDIPVHVSSDDFPIDGTASNAELRQRGGGSRAASQKSFRIKLDSKDVLWRNERFLQLNKHPFEATRIRNKLAFDMMKEVPHLPSMRTQFVNLWIDNGQGPVDYGLFTHVERPNDDYLRRRGLDADANLYKAEFFKFTEFNLQDIAIDAEGEPLDEDRFESALEIEEGDDHRPLVAMMTAFHDTERSFESVLDEHFNRNNVMAWMASNILLRQADATRQNYLLYNPSGTERFYFLPWDYDAAMGEWREPLNSYDNDALLERLEYGYAISVNSEFTSRFLKLPGMHEQMLAAVNEIHQNHITNELITERAELYSDLVQPFQTRLPDSANNPAFNVTSGKLLANGPAANADALKHRFAVPMPPTLMAPVLENGQWIFSWTPAYEVTGNEVTYDLHVASYWSFAPDNIVVEITGIEDEVESVSQAVDAARLPAGEYYVRLTARASNDPERFWQVSSNTTTIAGVRRNGVIRFTVPVQP